MGLEDVTTRFWLSWGTSKNIIEMRNFIDRPHLLILILMIVFVLVIFISPSDGYNTDYVEQPIQLTSNSAWDESPSWSPDGASIVFGSTRGVSWNIWLMNADGSNIRKVSTDNEYNVQPSWTYDSTICVIG